MFLVLKLVLIILLNTTYANITQDSEIILLPIWKSTSAKEIPLTLKVFGKLIQLNLRKNDEIVSPAFEKWKYNGKSVTGMSQLKRSCFYLHKDSVSFATISFCQENGLEGLIFVENDILEIRPLRNEFASLSLIDDYCLKEQSNVSFGKPHIVKTSAHIDDSNLYRWNDFIPNRKRRSVQYNHLKLTIQLAVFFDETAYRTFMPLLDNDKEKIRYMILAYVNCIQAAFHHPSLGIPIDISLVRLEIMEKQPPNLPVVDNASQLLRLFCNYAKTRNPLYRNKGHWDISLYLTGIDIYNSYKTPITKKMVKDYVFKGRSYGTSVCIKSDSCAIAELHAKSEIISLGLRSSLIADHEIGHVLGFDHEPKSDNSIMSEDHTELTKAVWSENNSNKIKKFNSEWRSWCLADHAVSENDTYVFNNLRYHNLPGREWTAKAQCEVFLRDKDANVVTLYDICQSLQCETPHKDTYYFAGPALPGTYCALDKECRREECVPIIEPPYIFKYCEQDNWSEWKGDSCRSNCLQESKGVLIKRRYCEHQTRRTANCYGPYYDMVLCDDSSLCNQKRKTIAEFTTMKCTEFSRIMPELEIEPGWQALHDAEKPWIACVIHCSRKNLSIYYAPRMEMLNFGINPYFPDGTWCHRENSQNYYCRQHYCLPQNYLLKEQWTLI